MSLCRADIFTKNGRRPIRTGVVRLRYYQYLVLHTHLLISSHEHFSPILYDQFKISFLHSKNDYEIVSTVSYFFYYSPCLVLWVLLARFASMAWSTALKSSFRLTWPCLIVEVLATQMKFLEPSGYCTMINCASTFRTTNTFGCFCCIMVQFGLVKYKFPN